MILPVWFRTPRLVILPLALALASCASSGKRSDEKKGDKNYDRAVLLVEAANGALVGGDPTGALQYLKQAEEADPSLPSIYHVRAIAFHTKKNLPMAITEMKKAVDRAPDDSNAMNTYGYFLTNAGKYDEAEIYLKKAAADATYRDAYKAMTSLGIIQYRRNQFAEATIWFAKAQTEDPANSCIAYFYEGHIASKLGKIEQAEKKYERATQKNCAGFAEAHFALGVTYEKLKQFEKARKKYLEIKQNFADSKEAEKAMERVQKLP